MSTRYTLRHQGSSGGDESVHLVDAVGSPIDLPDATLRLLRALARGPQQLDDLIDAVWKGDAPASAVASIHNRLSKLRRQAPDLVVRRHDRYSLGPGVTLATPSSAPGSVSSAQVTDVERAQRRVALDPYDEQAREHLIAALAASGQRLAALDELDRAIDELAGVGLDPGRRLIDLGRLVTDGEQRIERLIGDERDVLDIGMAIGSFAIDDVSETARRWLVDDGDGLLIISGPDGCGRSHALRVVRDLAVGLGRNVASIRAGTASNLPVIPTGEPSPTGAVVVMVDDADRANAATERLIERLAHRWAGRPAKVVVTTTDREHPFLQRLADRPTTRVEAVELRHWDDDDRRRLLAQLDLDAEQSRRAAAVMHDNEHRSPLSTRTALDALRLAFGDAHDRQAFDRLLSTRSRARTASDALEAAIVGFMVDSLDPSGRQLIDLLSLTVTPILLDDLEQLSPGARRQMRRREVRRLLDLDEIEGRVRTRDAAIDRAVLDRMSPRRRVELHTTLSRAPYHHEEPAVRARRHAAHGAEADLSRVDAARSVTSLADAVAATGDRTTAADISQLAAEALFPVDPAQFCELSIRAGTELLNAGDPIGLESIEAAFDVATTNGFASLAALATWSYCRLGPTSGAGRLDERATEMLEAVEPILHDDADLARVSTAWTMVHQLTGDSARCEAAFDRAEYHARAAGGDDLLIETLPGSYMSIATPEHLERRESIALELHQLAERSGRLDAEWEALHLDISHQLQRGDPAVRSTLDRLRGTTARLDGAQHDWELTYLSAVVAQLDGHLDHAMRLAEASLGMGDAVGESRRTAVFGAILLGNHLATGTVGELAPLLEQMIEEQPLLGAWRAPLALAATELGRFDQAIEQLEWLTRPGSIDRDCTMSAVAAVGGAAAAALLTLQGTSPDSVGTDASPERIAQWFVELLTPWSGRWSWYGAGTYGPIDTVLAQLHAGLGEQQRSLELAVAATEQAARLRAPIHSQAAAALLL